jgi:hypothetical protein
VSIIGDATTDFVLTTRDRLALALEVEDALADVRRRLGLGFLKSLETCLRAGVEELPGHGWSVTAKAPDEYDMMARGAYVALRRENWPVLPAEGQEADFHCVCLYTTRPDWAKPWVGLYTHQAEAELARRLGEAASDAVGPCLVDEEAVAYWWLEPPLNDWRQRAFLLEAGYPTFRDGAEADPVRDLAQQMLALARAAAPIYDEFLSVAPREVV